MYTLPETYEDEIAEVSSDAEFQNATIQILDPDLVTKTYDRATDEWTEDASNAVIYSGQARIKDIRWGVNRENSDTGNSTSMTNIRVQLPKDGVVRVKRGLKMTVTACASNPALLTYVFSSTSDMQGSHVASRTLQFTVDGDLVVE